MNRRQRADCLRAAAEWVEANAIRPYPLGACGALDVAMQCCKTVDYCRVLLGYSYFFRPGNAKDTSYWWGFDEAGTNARILSLLLAADMAEDGAL